MLFSVSKHYDLNSLGKLTHEFQTKAFTGIQHQSTGIRHYSDPTDRTLFYSTLFFTTSPFNDFSVQNVSTANRETTANRENGYDVCQTVLERLKCHVTSFESFKKLVGSCISSLLSKIKIMICVFMLFSSRRLLKVFSVDQFILTRRIGERTNILQKATKGNPIRHRLFIALMLNHSNMNTL